MHSFLQDFFLISSWKSVLSLSILACIFYFIFVLKQYLDFSKVMFIALSLGISFGFVLQYFAGFPEVRIEALRGDMGLGWYYETYVWFKFLSSVFVSFLKLLVVPIVFIGILYVMLTLKNEVNVSSLLGHSLFWLLFTTGIAAVIAVCLAMFFSLGEGIALEKAVDGLRELKSLDQILLGLMPTNIVISMGSNSVVGVVIFAFLIGMSARSVGKEKHRGYTTFVDLVGFMHLVLMKLAMVIIYLMPYAVIVMIAGIMMNYGFVLLKPALLFIALVYLSALCMFGVHLLILLFHGLNPMMFVKKAIPALIVAFTSRSSVATLPMSINTLKNKLGVSQMSASFVATLATSIGANGCAGYFGGLIGVFALNAVGYEVGLMQAFVIVLFAVITSVGVAGIPGTATMVASIMLTALGLGEYFGLLAIVLAIDPVMDMARTFSNVSGGMIASIATDKELGMLDVEKYNSQINLKSSSEEAQII